MGQTGHLILKLKQTCLMIISTPDLTSHQNDNLGSLYSVGGDAYKALVRASTVSDLGLLVDERLTWNDHMTNKANQRLGLVKRTLGYKVSSDIKLQCSKSMVVPLLEYGTAIWSNCGKT